ncbi:Hypothetical predicted protein, partial [Pelobates cultripes]
CLQALDRRCVIGPNLTPQVWLAERMALAGVFRLQEAGSLLCGAGWVCGVQIFGKIYDSCEELIEMRSDSVDCKLRHR